MSDTWGRRLNKADWPPKYEMSELKSWERELWKWVMKINNQINSDKEEMMKQPSAAGQVIPGKSSGKDHLSIGPCFVEPDQEQKQQQTKLRFTYGWGVELFCMIHRADYLNHFEFRCIPFSLELPGLGNCMQRWIHVALIVKTEKLYELYFQKKFWKSRRLD